MIILENPVFRIFEETSGVLSPQNGIFLKAFDRIQQNREHESLFRLDATGSVQLAKIFMDSENIQL
jgi:hypothetical protein